jgi:hypothetical protein
MPTVKQDAQTRSVQVSAEQHTNSFQPKDHLPVAVVVGVDDRRLLFHMLGWNLSVRARACGHDQSSRRGLYPVAVIEGRGVLFGVPDLRRDVLWSRPCMWQNQRRSSESYSSAKARGGCMHADAKVAVLTRQPYIGRVQEPHVLKRVLAALKAGQVVVSPRAR